MKKFLLLAGIAIISVQSAFAINVSGYFDQGGIYSGSSFPVDVARNADDQMPAIDTLRRGEATTMNILGLVETGNRGINKAMKDGGITKAYYVDTQINKVYIPLGFIPIYVKQYKTIVYGE